MIRLTLLPLSFDPELFVPDANEDAGGVKLDEKYCHGYSPYKSFSGRASSESFTIPQS